MLACNPQMPLNISISSVSDNFLVIQTTMLGENWVKFRLEGEIVQISVLSAIQPFTLHLFLFKYFGHPPLDSSSLNDAINKTI